MTVANLVISASILLLALLMVRLALPLVRQQVGMNHNYGFRFKESFESEDAWYLINLCGGRLMVRWAVAFGLYGIAALFAPMEHMLVGIAVIFCPVLGVVVMCIQGKHCARRVSAELRSRPRCSRDAPDT